MLSFYSSFELYGTKFKKLESFIIATEEEQEEYFCHSHGVSQASNMKCSLVQNFRRDEKHFSLHSKFIFLWCYLKYLLHANSIRTLGGKAKLFLPGFKHSVPGKCMLSMLRLPNILHHHLLHGPVRVKDNLLPPKNRPFAHFTIFS